jgi:hypothetical protein
MVKKAALGDGDGLPITSARDIAGLLPEMIPSLGKCGI